MKSAAASPAICRPWLGAAAVLLLALLSYANSFPGEFLLDDLVIVRDNPLVASLDLHGIFTTDYWGAASNTGLYRPLTILSFALNRLLLGHEPLGYHLVNVLLHAGVTVLVLRVLQRWGMEPRSAWLAAALFAVHPLHTEVVNQVVGRGELLAALFVLLALLLAALPSRLAAAGVLGSFALALLSKEHAVMLLALLPLLDWSIATDGQWWRRRWPLYLGLILLAAGWLGLRTWGVARVPVPYIADPVFTPLAYVAAPDRWVSALALQGLYLWKLLVPWPLQAFYADAAPSTRVITISSATGIAVITLAGAAITLIGLGLRHRSRAALFCLLYLLTFLPASNLLFATEVTFAERLTYLPSVWFCAALIVGVEMLLSRSGRSPWFYLFPGVYGLVLLGMTMIRNPDFSSNIRLWEANVAVSPRNVVAWAYLASCYEQAGHSIQADAAYRRALELAPDFPYGLRTYAGFLLQAERSAEAAPIALRATRVKEGRSPLAFLTLAEAYYNLGDYDESRAALDALNDGYGQSWYSWALRGKVLESLGEDLAAIEAYARAQPWPAGSDLPYRLGMLLLRHDRAAEAEPLLLTAAEQTGQAAAWNGLGVALARQGRDDEAAQAFQRAMKIEPAKAEYRENYRRIVSNNK